VKPGQFFVRWRCALHCTSLALDWLCMIAWLHPVHRRRSAVTRDDEQVLSAVLHVFIFSWVGLGTWSCCFQDTKRPKAEPEVAHDGNEPQQPPELPLAFQVYRRVVQSGTKGLDDGTAAKDMGLIVLPVRPAVFPLCFPFACSPVCFAGMCSRHTRLLCTCRPVRTNSQINAIHKALEKERSVVSAKKVFLHGASLSPHLHEKSPTVVL
jgi:hypothetical protein